MLLQSVQSGPLTDEQLMHTSRLVERCTSVITLYVLTLRLKLNVRIQANMSMCLLNSHAFVKSKVTEFLTLVSGEKEQPYRFIYSVCASVLVLLNKVYCFHAAR
jgi:hypothetical protein